MCSAQHSPVFANMLPKDRDQLIRDQRTDPLGSLIHEVIVIVIVLQVFGHQTCQINEVDRLFFRHTANDIGVQIDQILIQRFRMSAGGLSVETCIVDPGMIKPVCQSLAELFWPGPSIGQETALGRAAANGDDRQISVRIRWRFPASKTKSIPRVQDLVINLLNEIIVYLPPDTDRQNDSSTAHPQTKWFIRPTEKFKYNERNTQADDGRRHTEQNSSPSGRLHHGTATGKRKEIQNCREDQAVFGQSARKNRIPSALAGFFEAGPVIPSPAGACRTGR